nr:glycosyltransferase [Pseudonocardia lacus]
MVSEHASPLTAPDAHDPVAQDVHVRELALALAAAGHRVTVLARRDSPDLPDVVELATDASGGSAHLHPVTAGPTNRLPDDRVVAHVPKLADELARAWRADRPDVVHAHHWMSGLAALAAVRDLEVPLVQTFHGLGHVQRRHDSEHAGPAGRPSAEQVISRRADRVVATCEDELFELVRMGAPRKRISIVPHGVDVETFRPDGPALVRGERPRLVTLGGLAPGEGVDDVITALARVPDAELLVGGGARAGQPDAEPDLRRLFAVAATTGVADRVRFLGRVARENVPRLLRSADLVVRAPRHHSLGTVALEAMACGRAVVATAVGGMKDIVVDRVTGVHVPPSRPDRLAHTLRALLADRAMPIAYGIAGRDRVVSRYTWARIAAATEAVYAGVLDLRAAERPADDELLEEGVH